MNAQSSQPPLVAKLAASWPPDQWQDVTVLVAVSGGADSVALARGLHQLLKAGEGRLILAHFNHRLRGEESDADQGFVEDLARDLGCEILTESAPTPALPAEAALRDLRYAFLKRAAGRSGARYVATAHTADDQVETVLFNILRGTGLAGLAGIPRVRALTEAATIVRPLLEVTRSAVLEYLQQLGQTFREDASNESTDYARNRIRHELLPLLERDHNPHVRQALVRLARIAQGADDVVEARARRLLSRSRRLFGEDVEIQTLRLIRSPDLVARTALVLAWRWQGWPLADMSFERWEELLDFARAPADGDGPHVAPRMFPGGIRAEKQGGVLRLTRPE